MKLNSIDLNPPIRTKFASIITKEISLIWNDPRLILSQKLISFKHMEYMRNIRLNINTNLTLNKNLRL